MKSYFYIYFVDEETEPHAGEFSSTRPTLVPSLSCSALNFMEPREAIGQGPSASHLALCSVSSSTPASPRGEHLDPFAGDRTSRITLAFFQHQ